MRCTPIEGINRYIRRHKLSLRGMAERCNMSPAMLSKIRSGKAPISVEMAERLAGVMGVRWYTLVTRKSRS